MAKQREEYRCSACGAKAPRWSGQCTGCGEWNTLAVVASAASLGGWSARAGKDGAARTTPLSSPEALENLSAGQLRARATGIPQLDGLLGSGLVPGAAILLGGEPGVGKSTLLLQLAARQAERSTAQAAGAGQSIYVSGEESLAQIRGRAERLGLLGPGLMALATNNADDALAALAELGDEPGLIIVDSVQTLASPRAEGIPGSVSQVRAVSGELVEAVKRSQATLVLVGHVTKDGQIAGPRVVEHMVDAVMSFEGDGAHQFRILRAQKNRFGPTDEIGVFEMTGRGLAEVPNPSAIFLAGRDAGAAGAAVFACMEGTRPILVEIQALVAPSGLATPRRSVVGWDGARLAMVLAVLEAHAGLRFGGHDVYLNVAGGLRIVEPAADLAAAAALISSLAGQSLPAASVVFGEIGLSGAVRPVAQAAARLKEAGKLGFRTAIAPASPGEAGEALPIEAVADIRDLAARIAGG